MIHHVSSAPEVKRSGCLLETEKFYHIIEVYKENVIPLKELVAKREPKKIAITFDDGLADVYTIAYPFLKERNLPFTIFVVSDFIGKSGYLTKEQLMKMSQDPLITIGAHGVTHEILTKLDEEHRRIEIVESKKLLEEIIGKEVSDFAYSHGAYDSNCLELMKVYKRGYTAFSRPYNTFIRNPYLIPRFNLDNACFKQNQKILEKKFK